MIDHELNEREELLSIYSDTYKEKYAHRPSLGGMRNLSIEEIRAKFERLYDEPSYDELYPEH